MKHELRKIAKFGVEMPKSVRNTKLQSLQVLYIIVLRAEIVIFELKMSWKDNPYVMQTSNLQTLQDYIFHALQEFATKLAILLFFYVFFWLW